MVELNNNQSNIEQVEPDELDSIVSDIVQSQNVNNGEALDEPDETDEGTAEPESQSKPANQKTTSHTPPQRSGKSTAQDRIRELITQRDSAREKSEAALEKLSLMQEKLTAKDEEIASLRSRIEQYKELEKTVETIINGVQKGEKLETILEREVAPAQSTQSRYLSEEDFERKLKEVREKERQEQENASKQQSLIKERTEVLKHYATLIEANRDKLNDAVKPALATLFNKITKEGDKELIAFVKTVSKHDNALELLSGVVRKKDFYELNPFEKMELVRNLDDRLKRERAKISQAVDTSTPAGGATKNGKTASNWAEWRQKKNSVAR